MIIGPPLKFHGTRDILRICDYHQLCDAVAGLLREENFSLQGNAKTIEGDDVPSSVELQ